MERYAIKASGSVQGVGFRYFIYYTAKNYDLTGWVRNCEDDSVEIEAQGDVDSIAEFVDMIKIGNGYSEITDMDLRVIEPRDDERSFRITY